jgi:DNA-binding CsgD family transcriptional regulator
VSPSREPETSAAALLSEVRSNPSRRIVAGVAGIGGVGKKTLLDDIERHYRAAGIAVRRGVETLRTSPTAAPVLLVDDAQALADEDVRQLQQILDQGESSLIVSYRMWPRSDTLARLVRALERARPIVQLGALTTREVSEQLRSAMGATVSTAFASTVMELTGGMPWLVHRVAEGIRHHGRSVFEQLSIPDSVVNQLALEMAGIDEDLHDVLIALSVGFKITDQLSEVLRPDDAEIHHLVADATYGGLLFADGTPIPLVRQAVLRSAPSHRVHELQRKLIDWMVAAGRSLEQVAPALAREGLHDPRLFAALESAADHVLTSDPEAAAHLYAEAMTGDDAQGRTAARRAQAAWATGDLDEAGRILDELLGMEDPPDLIRGAQVAAAVWAERGMMERSAEIYRWLGPSRAGIHAPLGEIAMIATGDIAGATDMVARLAPASPTTLGVAVRLMGEGIRASIGAESHRALPTLVRASDMMAASQCSAPFPDSPAALAAIVALHLGDLDVAAAVLDDALAGDEALPEPANRLVLLRAWAAMQADRLEDARGYVARVRLDHLSPRDEFVLRALEIGLARRSDDHFELSVAWQRARAVMLHVPIDLFNLLPLGEMMVAAARLADSHRLDAHLTEAWTLLNKLGDPPLWSICLHWSSIQAAILAERPSDVARHAAALARFAPESRLSSVLASGAKAWLQILAGDVGATQAEHAARALAGAGFPWDGSRLAGHAAVRVEERKDMARLLACARDLRVGNPPPGPATNAADTRPRHPQGVPHPRAESARDDSGLSAREREVARLVLAGKTYREIGETIFISARTAEHHIARIRRQLGATNRSDLLAQLRIALGTDAPEDRPE